MAVPGVIGVIGVISDTHGLLRPEAVRALRGCSMILHAGDVGSLEVLDRLRETAPVIAVRGNIDTMVWAGDLPERARLDLNGRSLLMTHDRNRIPPAELAGGIDIVVSGHSHIPLIEERNGVLFVNPGSAGPRRFRLPVTLALLRMEKERARAELVELLVGRA